MKKIKITEFTSADAVKALIGAFIFNKVTGKDAQAKNNKNNFILKKNRVAPTNAKKSK